MTDGLREYLGIWRMSGKKFSSQAIRKGEMKLIHLYQKDKFMLYNLTADISENNDISADNQDLVDEMFEKLKEIAPCYDDVGRFDVYLPKKDKTVRKNCA